MSSDIRAVDTDQSAPAGGPYSKAIVAAGLVFVSGQIPSDKTGKLVEGSIAEKTAASIANVKAVLTAAGSDISRVVKVNVFLTDMANFAEMNGEFEKHFLQKPARSTVAVKQLPKGVPVEIECTALEGMGK